MDPCKQKVPTLKRFQGALFVDFKQDILSLK